MRRVDSPFALGFAFVLAAGASGCAAFAGVFGSGDDSATDPPDGANDATLANDGNAAVGSTHDEAGLLDDDASETTTDAIADGGTALLDVADDGAGRLRVFVLTETFSSSVVNVSGLCQSLASDAGLGGTWAPWLSTSTADAITRVGAGPWYRVDRSTLVTTTTQIATGGGLNAAVRVDQHGAQITGSIGVWTGTTPQGISSGDTCADWTGVAGSGTYGDPNSATTQWTAYSDFGPCSASNPVHVYCFETGK